MMSLCDGRAASYPDLKMRQQFLWLFTAYLDLRNEVDLSVPQYLSQGITYNFFGVEVLDD